MLNALVRLALEHWIFLLILAVAIAARKSFRNVESGFRPAGLADARLHVAVVVAVSLAVCAMSAALHGLKLPNYPDDFGYLLDADTFAHGRLSNPTHPLWPHFETIHVLQVPRYISKYPVAQGLIFAAGLRLFNNPLIATWIVTAVAGAAIWWAIRVWTTPALALLGGIAAAVHPTMLNWIESYHGGQLAALGGALMLGAAGRLREKPTWPMAAVLGLGVDLLTISRPYEGAIFCVGIGLLLLRRSVVRVAWAAAVVVVFGLAFQAVRNYKITGNPLLLPYSLYERQYDPVPNFIWETARPMPHYRNAEMASAYAGVCYMEQYNKVHAPGGLWKETLVKLQYIYKTVFGDFAAFRNPEPIFLVLILFAIPLLIDDRSARPLALVLLVFLFAPLSIVWGMQYHYLAPATAAVVCFVMLLVRRVFAASPLLATMILVLFFGNAAMQWFGVQTPDGGAEAKRRKIAASLLAGGGKHLVIVANDVFDAVYNGADLNNAPIVWARDLGPAADARLVAYYRGRKIWILERGGIKRY